MKIMKAAILAVASTIAISTTSTALAEKCSGHNGVKGEPAVKLIKKADGSQVMFIMSHRIHNVKEPANSPSDGAHGTSTGLWTVAPDGKSGSGTGHVYSVDKDGDTWVSSWEGTNSGGTWKSLGGTGKYEGATGSGTWSTSVRYNDGWRWQSWEGECNS